MMIIIALFRQSKARYNILHMFGMTQIVRLPSHVRLSIVFSSNPEWQRQKNPPNVLWQICEQLFADDSLHSLKSEQQSAKRLYQITVGHSVWISHDLGHYTISTYTCMLHNRKYCLQPDVARPRTLCNVEMPGHLISMRQNASI